MDMVINILRQLVYIIIEVSIFLYFLLNKKFNSYVRGVFLAACSFSIVQGLLLMLARDLNIGIFARLFNWDGSIPFILSYLGLMSYFLMVLGVTLLVGKDFPKREDIEIEYPTMHGKRRNILITLLLLVITVGIYTFFWLYKTVKDLKNNFPDEIPYTPGKAAGFLIIPIFNIFWALYLFISLPLRMKRIEEKYFGRNVGFYFHPVLIYILYIAFLIMAILFRFVPMDELKIYLLFIPPTSIFVLWLTIQAKLNAFFDFSKQATENN